MRVVLAGQLQHRSCVRAKLGDVVLGDVGSNMQGRYAPDHHERLLGAKGLGFRHPGVSEFPWVSEFRVSEFRRVYGCLNSLGIGIPTSLWVSEFLGV
jgi:hypothetical protein